MRTALLEETKSQLRSRMLKRRSVLPPATCLSWGRSILAQLLDFEPYRDASCLAIYVAIGNEVETRSLIDHALSQGKPVFCPKLSALPEVKFARLSRTSELVAGPTGAAEPVGDSGLNDADCESLSVIVPGVAFDGRGNRLGRGGGWYDRALRQLENRGLFIGLAYDFQVVDSLPTESWDMTVDYVVTETRIIDCGNAARWSGLRQH